MPDLPNYSNQIAPILISRNAPVALIVGVAGFIGSHIADKLLNEGVQVIGIDNFSTGQKINLIEATKRKNFHLLNQSILEPLNFELARLDYAFFVAGGGDESELFSKGITNFLSYIENHQPKENGHETANWPHKTKVALVSSIELYTSEIEEELKSLQKAEYLFAKGIKHFNLNGRVIRLAPTFGPRMHFRIKDPVVKLVLASIEGKLPHEQTSLEYISRTIYIKDAVTLILKSVFLGSTAHKIYDCALTEPIKVAEIKQILLDPSWHENNNFQVTKLPPWPTPNLIKTAKELSWRPTSNIVEALKTSINYFKEVDAPIIKEDASLKINFSEKRMFDYQPPP